MSTAAGLGRFDPLAAGYEDWFTTRIGTLVDRRQKSLLRRLVEPRAGQRILEVGSGTGHFLRDFAAAGARCLGMDPSAEMLTVAVDADRRGIDYVRACAEALPVAGERFDCVCFITTLEFVDDVAASLREAVRACTPGGRLVFVVLNSRGPWFDQRRREGGLWAETRFFSAEELRSLLDPLGDVTIDYAVHVPPRFESLPGAVLATLDAAYRLIHRREGALIGARVVLRRQP